MNFIHFKPNNLIKRQFPSPPMSLLSPDPLYIPPHSLQKEENDSFLLKRDYTSLMKEIPLLKTTYNVNSSSLIRKELNFLCNTTKNASIKLKKTHVETVINKTKIKDFHIIGVIWHKILLFFDPFCLNIIALDQHAIHERICYEILCSKLDNQLGFYNENRCFIDENLLFMAKDKEKNLCVTYTNFYRKSENKEIHSFFTFPEEIELFINFQTEFEKWGYLYEIERNTFKITVFKSPVLFNQNMELNGVYKDFLRFFQGNQKKVYRYPEFIDNVLMSKACKNAIKFNDKINKKQAELLKNNIGKCEFPFVCVHGRNSMFPILNLR